MGKLEKQMSFGQAKNLRCFREANTARIVNDWNANDIANGINVIRVIDWIKELGMKYPKTPLKIALQVVAL